MSNLEDKTGRARGWVFTLNNYTEDEVNLLSKGGSSPDAVVYLTFGKEVGDSGTPHLQGYIHFTSVKSFKQAKAAISDRAYVDKRKGTPQQAIEYCHKDGEVVEYGERPHQGKRTDLDSVCDLVLSGTSLADVAETHPTTFVKYSRGIKELKLQVTKPYHRDDVCGIWVYGPPGTGKSHWAQMKYPNAYKKPQSKWFDGYNGEKEIILDDLDVNCFGHLLKIWADKWPCTGETKGGTVHLMHDVFVVTSNYTIEELVAPKKDLTPDEAMISALKRRFKVFKLERKGSQLIDMSSVNALGKFD